MKTTASNTSAEPMRGLSKRAQEMCKPRAYGQQPGRVAPRNNGEIPQAFRSTKG